MGGVGLQGQAFGAVRLHQHKVRQFGQHPKGQRRRGQLAFRAAAGHAHHAVLRQRGGDGVFAALRQHWVLLRPLDVGGGGDDHRAPTVQLLRQRIQQRGLAAAADEGGNAPGHMQ